MSFSFKAMPGKSLSSLEREKRKSHLCCLQTHKTAVSITVHKSFTRHHLPTGQKDNLLFFLPLQRAWGEAQPRYKDGHSHLGQTRIWRESWEWVRSRSRLSPLPWTPEVLEKWSASTRYSNEIQEKGRFGTQCGGSIIPLWNCPFKSPHPAFLLHPARMEGCLLHFP